MTLEETIINMLAKQSERDADSISREDSLIDDLDLDSLDLTELAMEIEEEFDIDIYEDDEAEKVKTVDDLIKYVEDHVKAVRA